MHDEIEAAPGPLDLGERRVDAGEIGDVARDDDLGADRFRERNRAAPELLALVGEGELGSVRCEIELRHFVPRIASAGASVNIKPARTALMNSHDRTRSQPYLISIEPLRRLQSVNHRDGAGSEWH